jgi:hypothetical protein
MIVDQIAFDLRGVESTMIGFRFPAFAEGIEVGGSHLHFISADHRRGATGSIPVLTHCWSASIPQASFGSSCWRGIDLADPGLAANTHEALERVERQG